MSTPKTFFTVVKTFRVPVGHRLLKHKGLCKNIHGHNLKIEVGVLSPSLDENGMVIDFSDLKDMVQELLDLLDHRLILNSSDPYRFVLEKDFPSGVFVLLGTDPTAENISKYLFDALSERLHRTNSKLEVRFVRVWENEDSYAQYEVENVHF